MIAGETKNAPGFTTCAHCGVVARRRSATADTRHRGYCVTRRGGEEKWIRLLLSHELRTQAVRLLLPVSLLHFETTLASFKGALLLGLRKDFGGDPQHLAVVASSMTDGAGSVRRFLVLHDTVPGGTGYLDRFGEPERLRHILTLARDALAQCPCRTEARAACHRCLYGVLSPREMPNASRESALRLLEEFLTEWDVEEIETVTDVDIGKVQLSELEIRFREALKAHIEQRVGWSYEVALGSKGEELDIRLRGQDGDVRRWRTRPLVQLVELGVATEPDFLLTRVDSQTADIAIYLDGKQFHAGVENNRTADDARKRDALRRADKRVWSISWDDVAAFEGASRKAEIADLVHQHVKNSASEQVPDNRIRFMWDNPINFLIEYMTDPDAGIWGAGAVATALAMVTPSANHGDAGPVQVDAVQVGAALSAMAEGSPANPDASGPIMIVPRFGLSKLPIFICADQSDFQPTLGVLTVLDDSDAEVGGPQHDAEWRDWLRWSNILQFLTLPVFGETMPRRMGAVWTRKSIGEFVVQPVPLSMVPSGRTDIAFKVSDDWKLVYKYTDPAAAGVIDVLAHSAVPVPEPGAEVGPDESIWQVELAWEDPRVAVVTDLDEIRDKWLVDNEWQVFRIDDEEDQQLAKRVIESVKGARS